MLKVPDEKSKNRTLALNPTCVFYYQERGGGGKAVQYFVYFGINVLVYGKCLMVDDWSMTKKSFCFKTYIF